MHARDGTTKRQKALGEPAQGERLKGTTMNRQSAGLRDAFGTSLEHDDLHFCQSQLTRKPQSGRTATNYYDIEIIAHRWHSMFNWPSGDRGNTPDRADALRNPSAFAVAGTQIENIAS
jgi:hypothetical protein